MQIAKKVNISICTDDLLDNSNPDIDVFYPNKIAVNKILDIAKKNNITIQKNIELKNTFRFKNDEQMYRVLYRAMKNAMLNKEFMGNKEIEQEKKDYINSEYNYYTNNFVKDEKVEVQESPELIEIVGTCYILKTIKSLIFNKKAPNNVLQ